MLLDYKAIHNSGLSKTYTGLDLKVISNAHKNNFNFVVYIATDCSVTISI